MVQLRRGPPSSDHQPFVEHRPAASRWKLSDWLPNELLNHRSENREGTYWRLSKQQLDVERRGQLAPISDYEYRWTCARKLTLAYY